MEEKIIEYVVPKMKIFEPRRLVELAFELHDLGGKKVLTHPEIKKLINPQCPYSYTNLKEKIKKKWLLDRMKDPSITQEFTAIEKIMSPKFLKRIFPDDKSKIDIDVVSKFFKSLGLKSPKNLKKDSGKDTSQEEGALILRKGTFYFTKEDQQVINISPLVEFYKPYATQSTDFLDNLEDRIKNPQCYKRPPHLDTLLAYWEALLFIHHNLDVVEKIDFLNLGGIKECVDDYIRICGLDKFYENPKNRHLKKRFYEQAKDQIFNQLSLIDRDNGREVNLGEHEKQ